VFVLVVLVVLVVPVALAVLGSDYLHHEPTSRIFTSKR
jgi:hypothetical protein